MQEGAHDERFLQALEARAVELFEKEEDRLRWLTYWAETKGRNRLLLEAFMSRVQTHLANKTVLDVGCGTGGLATLVCEADGTYIGVDFNAIISFARMLVGGNCTPAAFARASGTHIPLQDGSCDYIVAFDVIEHLVGGYAWQLQFLRELERLLKPGGLVFLTTQNRLNPMEGHTFLPFPQFLPSYLADIYVRWRSPWFFREYRTFGEVKLLWPWTLRRLLRESGLSLLHDLPWCMDLEDNPRRRRRVLQALKLFGMDWSVAGGFWLIACRPTDKPHLARLKKKEWLRAAS